jgi:hydroxypyruvate reductase
MNAVRRHMSLIKGGQLARATVARTFGTLALSDVVGDTPEDIASGPTVPDPSTYQDALEVVRRYRLASRLPARVVRHLRDGACGRWPETPKPGDPRFQGAPFVLAATNRTAIEAAAREARRRRYLPRIVSRPLVGETQPVARAFARRLRHLNFPHRTRARALLAGGETTVSLGPHPGRGGRNQEFSLAAAAEIAGKDMLVLSIGTDGIDGPTDAAGGWANGGTVERAHRRGVNLGKALAKHAAYDALVSLGSLVRTGPTGTNVMDLHVGLARFPGQSG